MFHRHHYVVSSEYDNAFRALTEDNSLIEDRAGSLMGSAGYGIMMTLTMSNIHIASALLDVRGEPIPSQGLYIVHNSGMGIIVVFCYDDLADFTADWREFKGAAE